MNLSGIENNSFAFENGEDYSYLFYYEDVERLRLPWIQEPHFFLTVTVYGLAFFLGILGNSLVIFAVCGDRKARSVTSSFMVSLAVADLMFLLVCAPYETFRYFMAHTEGGSPVCKFASFVDMLSAVASILNLTSVSVERYIVIVHPMLSRWWCTPGNTKKILPAVWAVAVCLSMPCIFVMDIESVTYYNNVTSATISHCYDSAIPDDKRLAYAIYQLTVMFVAPTIIMVICYSFVIHVLWLSSKQLRSMTSPNGCSSQTVSEDSDAKRICLNSSVSAHSGVSRSSHQRSRQSVLKGAAKAHSTEILKARRQVMKMLITIVVAFLICWGPRLIFRVMQRKGDRHSEHDHTLKVVFGLLPYIQSCLNPIIYGFMSKNFRRSMRMACRNHICRTREKQICMGHRIHLSDYEMESRSINGTIATKMSLRTIESVSSDDN